jgi:hypothetical protein
LEFTRKDPTSKVAAEKSISIEINVNMFAYATLLLAGVGRDLTVVELVRATLGACSVVFESFLTSIRTGVPHCRDLVFAFVFDRFNLPEFQSPVHVPRIAEKKSPRLAGRIVPDLEA